MYSTRNTYLVEPRTGVIVQPSIALDAFVEVQGERVIPTTKGTFVGTDDVVVPP